MRGPPARKAEKSFSEAPALLTDTLPLLFSNSFEFGGRDTSLEYVRRVGMCFLFVFAVFLIFTGLVPVVFCMFYAFIAIHLFFVLPILRST